VAVGGMLLCCVNAASAQRLTSFTVGAGAVGQADAVTTAAFAGGAGIDWEIPWLVIVQRSVADLKSDTVPGTLRVCSIALMPALEPLGGYVLLATGPSLHHQNRDVIGPLDDSRIRMAWTGVVGFRIPIAGKGVSLELIARADAIKPEPQFSGLFGVHVRRGVPHTLVRGEPVPPRAVAASAAAWNDVLMQLILLQQSLESFDRIKEIENGIELQFDLGAVTLYDDVAKAARVLAAADPPVTITVFAPNAGRTGAAVTAGSFPAERLRFQRDDRVYLRVTH
jgi:hypothetical protein